MKRFTTKSIISMEFSMDSSDLEDYRYHYGRTNKPVYVIGDDYYCAAKLGQKPAKHQDGMEWNWQEHNSSFAKSNGWQIWVARV